MRSGGSRRRRRHDVGNHVVHADAFALSQGAKSDLNLGHTIGIGVVFGVFAEFLRRS